MGGDNSNIDWQGDCYLRSRVDEEEEQDQKKGIPDIRERMGAFYVPISQRWASKQVLIFL